MKEISFTARKTRKSVKVPNWVIKDDYNHEFFNQLAMDCASYIDDIKIEDTQMTIEDKDRWVCIGEQDGCKLYVCGNSLMYKLNDDLHIQFMVCEDVSKYIPAFDLDNLMNVNVVWNVLGDIEEAFKPI